MMDVERLREALGRFTDPSVGRIYALGYVDDVLMFEALLGAARFALSVLEGGEEPDYEAANDMHDSMLDSLRIPHDNWAIDMELVVQAAIGKRILVSLPEDG